MTRAARLPTTSLLVLLILLAPGRSVADRERGGDAPRRFAAGIKAGYLGGLAGGELHHFGGGGVFFEWAAVPHWVSLELNLKAMGGPGATLPIDLLLVRPFHLSATVHPYAGIGPAVSVDLEGSGAAFGFAAAAGVHLWITQRVGLLAELNYALLSEHGVHHEIGGLAGFMVGW